MSFINWTVDLETDIEIIDNQHKRIVDYINELYETKDHHDKNVTKNILDELVDYTISHFAFEESMMEQAGYPFLRPHIKIHELFIKKVNALYERFEKGEDVTDEILTLLQKWLVNHIQKEDADYVNIVQENMHKIMHKKSGWLKKLFG